MTEQTPPGAPPPNLVDDLIESPPPETKSRAVQEWERLRDRLGPHVIFRPHAPSIDPELLQNIPTIDYSAVVGKIGPFEVTRPMPKVGAELGFRADSLIAAARATHEANRAYCIALGDTSQVPWELAPKWQTDSALTGVAGVLLQGHTPEQSHENWMRGKFEAGWVYGPIKDPERKTHPALVPYDELPVEQQRKDHIFHAVAHAVFDALEGSSCAGDVGPDAPEEPEAEDSLAEFIGDNWAERNQWVDGEPEVKNAVDLEDRLEAALAEAEPGECLRAVAERVASKRTQAQRARDLIAKLPGPTLAWLSMFGDVIAQNRPPEGVADGTLAGERWERARRVLVQAEAFRAAIETWRAFEGDDE